MPFPRSTNQTIIDVDHRTYRALQLAQDAITYTHAVLDYGAGNLAAFQEVKRDGTQRPGVSRLLTAEGLRYYQRILRSELSVDVDSEAKIGAIARIAHHIRSGTCTSHAAVAYDFLCKNGLPGMRIQYWSIKFGELSWHRFPMITWNGCGNPVVSDAWQPNAKPCRWSEAGVHPKNMTYPPQMRLFPTEERRITRGNAGNGLLAKTTTGFPGLQRLPGSFVVPRGTSVSLRSTATYLAGMPLRDVDADEILLDGVPTLSKVADYNTTTAERFGVVQYRCGKSELPQCSVSMFTIDRPRLVVRFAT